MKTVGSLPYASPVAGGDQYGSLPGSSGNYFSSPDSAAASITGDIDIIACIAPTKWIPAASVHIIGKWTSAPNLSYQFWLATSGKLNLSTSANGSASSTATSSLATGLTDGIKHFVRVTRSSSTGVVKFYLSRYGAQWIQLGDDASNTSGAIADTGSNVEVGIQNAASAPFSGSFYSAKIYNGINGTLAVNFDAADYSSGNTWTAQNTSETWTINGTASIVVPAAQPVGAMKVIGTTVAATLPAGTVYYNGFAYHPDGSLYVVFG